MKVPRGILRDSNLAFAAKLLIPAALAAGMVMALQDDAARIQYVHKPVSISVTPKIFRGPAIAAAPSVFDRESAMSPQQLLDRWDPLIKIASRRFGVSQAWIRAVMRMESGGRTMLDENQPMTSDAGAMGIMQVMPETYKEMRAQYGLGADPYDPHDNVLAGTAYLRFLHEKYGYPGMFAAYNDGPGNLDDHIQFGRTLPAETRAYTIGITNILSGRPIGAAMEPAKLTRPDGSPVLIDAAAVLAIHAALPGEYAPSVQSIVIIGKLRQAVREDVATATAVIRDHGGGI